MRIHELGTGRFAPGRKSSAHQCQYVAFVNQPQGFTMSDPILIARHGDIACSILPGLANRHGLITGATGTGKTVTL